MSSVGFGVAADAYERFMGRYSRPLAKELAAFAGVTGGQPMRIADVGCGPGALTDELVARLGPDGWVVGVEPSAPFVAAVHGRHDTVVQAAAEAMPLLHGCVDAALAQLVVHFMTDPVAGLREMARVTRPGGVVAACVWIYDEGGGPLSLFWEAAGSVDASAPGEIARPGARRGQLAALLGEAGLVDVAETTLAVSVQHPTFEDWWAPYELGVGPAGVWLASLSDERRAAVRERCRDLLPPAPFDFGAAAWAARGTVVGR
jgi:SAM-dependent methyltransferase